MRKYLLIILILFSVSWNGFGQGSTLKGTVTDPTGEPLPGVNIVIDGTSRGTTTDIDGHYEMKMSEETATLLYSFIGYKLQKVQYSGQPEINIKMEIDAENLEEVVITAQAKGQKNAINQQINSSTIKNVVAPDRLQENPDANSVEAIGRLPGISVTRDGGEGNSLVIRGLEAKYTAVTLNGVNMPSTSGSSRETNISGISQYVLQEVEVYKALTADMEANSVGGTVNLKLREAPKGLHYNLMAQSGYNDLNNYYGNYKLQGEFSDRFFKDKLGLFISANTERVNRSTQTMSAGYGLESTNEVDILLGSVSLNNIESIKYRRSAMLSLDYKIHPSTTLSLYSLYSYSKDDYRNQNKNYGVGGIGSVSYSFHDNPYKNNDILQSALSGVTKFNFLNLELDYGVSYSFSNTDDPKSRSWGFDYTVVPTDAVFSNEIQRKDPSEIIPLYHDDGNSLQDLRLNSISRSQDEMKDKNLSTYLNFKVPFRIGSFITGEIKTGGTYRKKTRFRDVTGGTQQISTNQFANPIIADSLDWVVRAGVSEYVTAVGLQNRKISGFLNGKYDYGYNFRFDRLNEIADVWDKTSEYWYSQGQEVWSKYFPKEKIGYQQDLCGSMIDDQDINENYYAGYLSARFNVGKWLMFMPGVRYEKTEADMKGFRAIQPTITGPTYEDLPGSETEASREDNFWLPMIHLRVTPHKSFYTHLAYTETLCRPDFNQISPNAWFNTGFSPFAYTAQNPDLKAEFWKNYDAQLTFHGEKIGLVSVSGFYKTVRDKIWTRSYKRIKGDPVIEPFPDASLVNVTVPENHKYPVNVKGLEFEVQTSFWYLPKPFSYFTFTGNYTYTQSETKYPLSWIKNVIPTGGGRPVSVRVDSTATGPMLYQPKHIINGSLGFNKGGTNIWLSFQYNGEIFTEKNYQLDELDKLKEKFLRWDLQITQKLRGKLDGFEFVGNFANLSDFTEKSRLRGDRRPTYLENYGWTVDLGIRYRF